MTVRRRENHHRSRQQWSHDSGTHMHHRQRLQHYSVARFPSPQPLPAKQSIHVASHIQKTLTILLSSVPRISETCTMQNTSFRMWVCWLAACHAAQMPFMLTDNAPHLSVSVYYVAVRTIVLSRHGSNLARPVIIHDIIHGLIYVPSTPYCGFFGVSPDGNCAYDH